MELNGEYKIPVPRDVVWTALNDVEVLKTCIPGCESVEKIDDTRFKANVTAKVGPVKSKFLGDVSLSDLNPPESYRISGQGQGGAAGFAKGDAFVSLAEVDGGTILSYKVDATVGGKLAQIGQRFIDATARKMADEFFTALSDQLGGEKILPPEAAPMEDKGAGLSPMVWVSILIVVALLLIVYMAL